MRSSASGPSASAVVFGLVLLMAAAGPGFAQVGTVDPLPYPGWVPSDRVAPIITVQTSYSDSTGLWTYRYNVANDVSAEQDIWEVSFRLGGWTTRVSSPTGWSAIADTRETFSLTGPGIMGAGFLADLRDDKFTGNFYPPSDYQIPPGASLSGFVMESPFPPGYVRTYTQGYAAVPFPPDPAHDEQAYLASHPVPHDTLDSQRGFSIGPARYEGVMTRGNLNVEGAEGFLGFMNLALTGTILQAPAPIALKLSLAGETVFRETFRAVLNGVDVTAQFHPGLEGGADLVGLFYLDDLALVEGRNVLVTTIEGLIPGTTRRAIDEDLIDFQVVR